MCEEVDSLYEKLEGPDAEKCVFRLARKRHKATMDIEEVRTYFITLYNEEFSSQPSKARPPIAEPVPEWTVEEVRTVLKKVKKGVAVAPDNIPSEVWKALEEEDLLCLMDFLNNIITRGRMPRA
ncbi:hypothetical protein ANCDUO_25728 [Ancylostoma duodenale]|uniref:Uncharacterized protein n=1 Tax=Ancylostoma duodenale TaxID=51022 RepID=A0A0C2FH49_9BILA|nr:hypothetical protein ANCDUO_25728 [Ancylostoma duodenale]